MRRDLFDVVRESAAEALAALGPEAASVAPAINESLTDRCAAVRAWSAIALWRINPDTNLIPALIAELGATKNSRVCAGLIAVLANAGGLAKPAVPIIQKKMQEYRRSGPDLAVPVLSAAREALRKIDPEAADRIEHENR